MATITISDRNYQSLVQKAKLLNSSPEAIVEEILTTLLMSPTISDQTTLDMTPGKTLGDLLDKGYGLWVNRDDMEDSVLYAKKLRQTAWQRSLTHRPNSPAH